MMNIDNDGQGSSSFFEVVTPLLRSIYLVDILPYRMTLDKPYERFT
jgi:hypothetical protein